MSHFCDSGDVCPGFQGQGILLCLCALLPARMDSPDSPLVWRLLTFWQASCFIHALANKHWWGSSLGPSVLLSHSMWGSGIKDVLFKISRGCTCIPKPWTPRGDRFLTHLELLHPLGWSFVYRWLCVSMTGWPCLIPFHGELSDKRLKVFLTWLVSQHCKRVVFLSNI